MNEEALKRVQQWFEEYAWGYAGVDGEFHPMLRLKFDHSLRVQRYARQIATELAWSQKDINLADALGLLHDIGRFPQFKQYGTLQDARSIDHGECGFCTATRTGVLVDCHPSRAQWILDGIRFHNRREIPAGLEHDSLRFVKLVRDADKLDIFHIVVDTIRNATFRQHPEILAGIDPDGPLNPVLVNEVREQRRGTYEHVRSLADWIVLMLAWVYNLNYLPTLHEVTRAGFLEDLIGLAPDTPEVRAIVADTRSYFAEKFAEGKSELQ